MEQVSLGWLQKDCQLEEGKESIFENRPRNHKIQTRLLTIETAKRVSAGEKAKKGWKVGRGKRRFGRKKKMKEVVIEHELPKVSISGWNSLDGGGIETELTENVDAAVLWV